ncbi:aminotransferase class IV [Gammaproteobacteria bacterium]|nr:aminotransferase class IV [Gammaproteobacteria bacterium]MDA9048841.1 aminotransferase class IV [Gammaproteobacteria bacterium]MDA9371083.1 aminotransferase class IV [Gammaproteobacteria bacterium]MDB4210315.1 aminotransferase class IV [Gammaproteobacteria bacterium]MDB9790931.1 aminotransferase class IV [Gammaproteobacteria bacterium]|tara:strand:+ start:9476 stop:10324 length:849 start_codon:yes stop_codon:yes gene_type:complete
MIDIPAIYQGQMSSLKDIRVSPLSRAYTFSDSVYEVIPYFAGHPLCFSRHIERLASSLQLSHISVDMDVITSELKQLGDELGNQDGYIYFQVSRGVDEIRAHLYADDLEAERFGYAFQTSVSVEPISGMLCEDNRWAHCNIKSTSLLGNVLSMNQARQQGCNEVIMHRAGNMTEAGASNVFYLNHQGIVRTSALTENILPGITRAILLEALTKSNIEVEEGECDIQDFNDAPAIWLTSSTKGMLPLTSLIGTTYFFEKNNLDYLRIKNIFNDAVELHLLAAK